MILLTIMLKLLLKKQKLRFPQAQNITIILVDLPLHMQISLMNAVYAQANPNRNARVRQIHG